MSSGADSIIPRAVPVLAWVRAGTISVALLPVAATGCLCSKPDTAGETRSRAGKPVGEPTTFLTGLWAGDGVAESTAEDPKLITAIIKLTALEFTADQMRVKNLVKPEASYTQSYRVVRSEDATLHVDTKRDGHPVNTAKIVIVDDDTIWMRHGTDAAYAVYRRKKTP